MEGSSIRFSSSEYSARRVVSRSLLKVISRYANGARPLLQGRAPSKQLLLLGCVHLRVLRLELGDPAGGVQNALLAGVERVAGAAGLDTDVALGGAAGGEGAAAGADDLGGRVLRVDAALHGV